MGWLISPGFGALLEEPARVGGTATSHGRHWTSSTDGWRPTSDPRTT